MQPLVGSYNWVLVGLAFAISVMGSVTAIFLVRQTSEGDNHSDRLFWVSSAAVALGGGGIWSMHFIGMASLELPILVRYDFVLTFASLLIAFLATGIGFAIVHEFGASWKKILPGGIAMGLGIVGMHYTGMTAMRMTADLSYRPWIVVASVVFGCVAGVAALKLAFACSCWKDTIGGGLLMGVAVCGTHFTAMKAAVFTPNLALVAPRAGTLSPEALAYGVFLITLVVIAMALAAVTALRRGSPAFDY